MAPTDDRKPGGGTNDPFDLNRFVHAQEGVHETALREIRDGAKRSHWMWFIFPQIAGLGSSPLARHYAISGLEEARCFLSHPVLGPRLREMTGAAMTQSTKSARALFGTPDDLKFRSSMTLFEAAAEGEAKALFSAALEAFHGGARDPATLERL